MFSSSWIGLNLVYGTFQARLRKHRIHSATRMVRKSIGEMIPEDIWTRIETVAVSVSGMVHTREDRMPKKSNQKE